MAAVDFISVLGRLLRDGALRDALAIDPRAVAKQLGINEIDRAALLQIQTEDLEFQAGVLLRKRFDNIRFSLPETCRLLDVGAWPTFRRYARGHWPDGNDVSDALGFCDFLERNFADSISRRERNRLHFIQSGKLFSAHLSRIFVGGKTKSGIQILYRLRSVRWREIFFYIGF